LNWRLPTSEGLYAATMVALLKSHGLSLEGGVLAKPVGLGGNWNSNALLDIPQPERFRLTIKILTLPAIDDYPYLVGIASKKAKISTTNIETKEKLGIFLNMARRSVYSPHLGTDLGVQWPLTAEFEWADTGFPQEIEISYIDGALYLAEPGQNRTKIVDNIPPHSYRPCISIGCSGVRLRISVSTPAMKRAHDGDGDEALKLARSLWADRDFADAKIVCGKKSIAVHRCVLAAASPFFAKAFKGKMREASQGEIVIKDAGEDAMEAFLQYLYTKSAPDEADTIELLPLAHRFESAGLVQYCVADIIENVTPENVATNVAALRPFKDDPGIQQHWADLCQRLASDPALVEGLMNG